MVHLYDNVSPYECCGSVFRTVAAFDAHQTSHTNLASQPPGDPGGQSSHPVNMTKKPGLADQPGYSAVDVKETKEQFPCLEPRCSKLCATSQGLAAHKHRSHPSTAAFQCTGCGKGCSTKRRLAAHVATHHSEASKIVVGTVSKGKAAQQDDQSTQPEHPGQTEQVTEKAFKCLVNGCTRSYNSTRQLIDHQFKKHQIEKPVFLYKCMVPGCTNSYEHMKELMKHDRACHQDDEATNFYNKSFKCTESEDCSLSFPDKQSLDKHIFKKHTAPEAEGVEGKFKCPALECNKSYHHETLLVKHHNTTHTELTPLEIFVEYKLFRCPVLGCKKSYDKEAQMVSHHNRKHPDLDPISVPEVSQKFRCPAPDCKKSYPTEKGVIQYHNGQHNDREPMEFLREFACPERDCPKSFGLDEDLILHHATKHAERPHLKPLKEFRCTVSKCLVSHDDENILVKHHNLQHADLEPIKAITREFVCPASACGLGYDGEKWLIGHHNHKHPDREPLVFIVKRPVPKPAKQLVCRIERCGKSYDELRLLNRHYDKEHKDCTPREKVKTGFQAGRSEPKNALASKTFLCPDPDCERLYPNQLALDAHYRRLHKSKHFLCGYNGCKHRSTTEAGLRAHQSKTHSLVTCVFPDCNVPKSTRQELDAHSLEVHGRLKYKKRASPKRAIVQKEDDTDDDEPHIPLTHRNTRSVAPNNAKGRKKGTAPRTPMISNAQLNAEIQEDLWEEYAKTPAPITPGRFGARSFAEAVLCEQAEEEDILLPTPRAPRRVASWSSSEPSLASSRSPSSAPTHRTGRPLANPDDSDSDMSLAPEDLRVAKRSFGMSTITPLDMDSYIRFPNEINGIAAASPGKSKRSYLVPKVRKIKVEKEVINEDPKPDEVEISYNIANIDQNYGRMKLTDILESQATEHGGILHIPRYPHDALVSFRTTTETPAMNFITRQREMEAARQQSGRQVITVADRSRKAIGGERLKFYEHVNRLAGKKKRAYYWRDGGKRADKSKAVRELVRAHAHIPLRKPGRKNKTIESDGGESGGASEGDSRPSKRRKTIEVEETAGEEQETDTE